MDFLTAYNNQEYLDANRFRTDFICPRCHKKFEVRDAKKILVQTDSKVTGYERHGNMSKTTYSVSYNWIRFCPKCANFRKYLDRFEIAYYIIPCLVISLIVCCHYFNSAEILGYGELFWGKFDNRDGWGLFGWIIGIWLVGLTIQLFVWKFIKIFINTGEPSLEQAIKDNSLDSK
jgi:hypothetical protein